MNIILFGPAGSGKSLQGQILAEKYDWRWLSVGQLLRDQHDPQIDANLKNGELFDDNFVTKLMSDAMRQAATTGKSAILDGYPRNAWQAAWMTEQGDTADIAGAIILDVPAAELWQRIQQRGRNDDTEATVQRRWEIYEQNIYSILPILEQAGIRHTRINGVGSVPEVTQRIENTLKDWQML